MTYEKSCYNCHCADFEECEERVFCLYDDLVVDDISKLSKGCENWEPNLKISVFCSI